MNKDDINSAIYGGIVGDALGAPYENLNYPEMIRNPATGMKDLDRLSQPMGTWTDDTSLTLALLDSLSKGVIYGDIMDKFLLWLYEGAFTPQGESFDVGRTIRKALEHYRDGVNPTDCGGRSVRDNGNGSLMRIMPLLLYINTKNLSPADSLELINNVSALTHAHRYSTASCNIYNFIVQMILDEKDKYTFQEILSRAIKKSREYYDPRLYSCFRRLYNKNFFKIPVITSNNGYVVDTLEIALYCCYHTTNYKDAILKTVNIGGDTDTNCVIAGQLAGLYYGFDSIPPEWITAIQNKELINHIINKFYNNL